MDQKPTIFRLFSIGLLIGCYLHLVTGLPNTHNAYHNRKIDEERPVLAMANSPRCLYNGRPVENGFKVLNPEPCLNCTCNSGMLLCYLQTCPTLVVPSKDCHVGRAEGACCPQVRCKNLNSPYRYAAYQGGKPKHPNYKYDTSQETMSQNIQKPTTAANGATTAGSNAPYNTDHYFVGSNHKAEYSDQFYNRFRRTSRMPTSTTPESSTTSVRRRRPQPQIQVPDDQDQLDYQSGLPAEYEEGTNATTGECYSKGYKYPEGMAMLSTSKCEYCYCIRGQQMCVRPKCHLNIAGCVAKYQSGFTCCPSHYECVLPDGNDGSYASIGNSIRVPAENKVSSCKVDGQEFEVGVAVASKGHCQTCYCTQVGVVCRRIECSPAVEGCKAVIPEGHCCPTEYECKDAPLNQTRVPVSHSTDNYDVMVISPSASTFTEEEEKEEQEEEGSSQATHDMYEYDEEQQESTTDKDRITVELTKDSNLESVSLIPEENLAVLVLTTEAEEENAEQEKSTDPSYQEEEQQQQQETESVTPYFEHIRTRPSSLPSTEVYKATKITTDHTDTPESYTQFTEHNDVRDEIHTNKPTTKVEEHTFTSEKHIHSAPTVVDSRISSTDEGDYYYEDYYPNDEGDYYPLENLPVQNPITFSPFSEYGTSKFGDKMTTDEHGSEPSTKFHTDFFPKQTTSTSVSYSVHGQTIQQHTQPYYGDEIEEFDKSTQQPIKEAENDIDPTENVNEYSTSYDKTETESVISEKYPSTKERTHPTYFIDEHRTKTTQTNQQQQQEAQAQETIVPNKLDTDPTSTTQKRTMYTSLSTQTIPPAVTKETPTEKTAFVYAKTEESTESTITAKTEAEDYDQPSSMKSDMHYRTSTNQETDQTGLPQKRYTNTVPVEIADLIWAITNAQAAYGNKTEQTDTTAPETETKPHDNTSPPPPEKQEPVQSLASAAPKLIIEQTTTTKENGQEEKEISSDSSATTDGTLFKYKSPLVVFSNHGPSAPIRPLSSLQPGVPSIVNNHKVVSNHAPARRKPYRPLSSSTTPLPSTPAVEFSNHRPTHTLRRPPALKGQSRPGMVMKVGVHKTHRPTEGSFKNHRIVSDSVPSSNDPSESREETDGAEYQYSEEEIGKPTKDFPQNYFEAKPVSVSLTIDHKAKPDIPENVSNTSAPQIPNTQSNDESKDSSLKEIITKNIQDSKPFIRNENEKNNSSEMEIIKKENHNKQDISNSDVDSDSKLNHTHGQSPEHNTENSKVSSVDDAKLSRADDETHSKGLDSPFVDRRLTSYVGSPLQRLPEIRPKLPNLEPPQVPVILSEEEEKQEITDVCFVDGRYYKSGEVIVKSNPCEMCRCFYGYPLCQVQQCPNPPDPTCMLEYLPGYCCPRVTCGVKSDDAKPPSEMSQPDTPIRTQTSSPPPFPVADNQWKPLPNAYPQHSKKGAGSNIKTANKDNIDSLLINHSVNNLEKTPVVTFKQTETNEAPKVPHVEELSPNEEKAVTVGFITLPPITTASPTVPNPVFNHAGNKDNSSSIHDNSSGVRKILNGTVVLPASKVSLSPVNASDITVLPLVHEISTAAPSVEPSTSEPLINNELREFTVELGGNLKVSGCNVYGQYYKINDKVSALSKNCTECICSAAGISCSEIC